jgi:hypothetical protein
MPFLDPNAPGGGNGTESLPYNTVASGTLGSGDWYVRVATTLAMGAQPLNSGANTTIRKWGEGPNPQITFTGEGFSSATATGTILLEDVDLVRTGSRGGTGVNATLMSGVSANITLRRAKLLNWGNGVQGDRCRTLVVEDNCEIVSTYGIRGRAHAGVNCENWRVDTSAFTCGVDMELFVSNTDCSLGSFNNLHIIGNDLDGAGATAPGTSLLIRGQMNATDYAATASITGGNTLVRDIGSPVWPNWQAGTVLFLAGWADRANFGTVVVVSGGGTRSVVVTNLGATLVNEAPGIGKGCCVFDPLRAFNNPVIQRNIIRNRGETPVFMDNFRRGHLKSNEVHNTVNIGTVAAAFEGFGCIGTLAEENIVDGMYGAVGVDSMGLFWDGACEDSIGLRNEFRNIRPTTVSPNAGAAMANFFSRNCQHLESTAENCILGFWAGGNATTATVGNNDLGGCDIGVSINSAPAAGAITVRSNDIQRNGQGIRDSSSAYVLGNSWSQNVIDNAFGTLASKDPGAVPAGQEFRLLPTPIRQVGAHPRAALEYVD